MNLLWSCIHYHHAFFNVDPSGSPRQEMTEGQLQEITAKRRESSWGWDGFSMFLQELKAKKKKKKKTTMTTKNKKTQLHEHEYVKSTIYLMTITCNTRSQRVQHTAPRTIQLKTKKHQRLPKNQLNTRYSVNFFSYSHTYYNVPHHEAFKSHFVSHTAWKYHTTLIIHTPFSSDREHLSYDGCLEVRLSELFCAVLCIEVVHSHKHT